MRENFEGKHDPKKESKKFVSPEKRKVTERSYEEYLRHFDIPEESLEGKRILDIGAGLSDFVKKVNEKFKKTGTVAIGVDPLYARLGENIEEFNEALGKANLEMTSVAGRKYRRSPKKQYQDIKAEKLKVAGSHQTLPFPDESFDLILAHNSISQYKDRTITKKALEEALRVQKPHGEIRILPADFLPISKEDVTHEFWYIHTLEPPTPELRKEKEETGLLIPPDQEVFHIFRKMEEQGVTFFLKVHYPKGRFPRMPIMPSCALIVRKDQEIPHYLLEDVILKKLSFRDSPDGLRIPAITITLPKKENDSVSTDKN